jgi:hypothetical protein
MCKVKERYAYALVLLVSLTAAKESRAEDVEWGKPVDGLQLSVQNMSRIGDKFSFDIKIKNSSAKDLFLNAGSMLGNGQQMWDSLTVELEDSEGKTIPISLGWQVAGGAGRIYFLGLPLRQSSTHTVNVSGKDYWLQKGDALKPGKYRLRCLYNGVKKSTLRHSTDLPDCWEGNLVSNTLSFDF